MYVYVYSAHYHYYIKVLNLFENPPKTCSYYTYTLTRRVLKRTHLHITIVFNTAVMHIHGIFLPLNTSVDRRDISNKNNISDISYYASCGVYNALHVYSTQIRRSKGEN